MRELYGRRGGPAAGPGANRPDALPDVGGLVDALPKYCDVALPLLVALDSMSRAGEADSHPRKVHADVLSLIHI
eukprot:288311-Lingulodinium_polyedra.AAC.1